MEKQFWELSKNQQEKIIADDLVEIKNYVGSWERLRRLIHILEHNENEDAYERHTSGGSDAWSGGFAENH